MIYCWWFTGTDVLTTVNDDDVLLMVNRDGVLWIIIGSLPNLATWFPCGGKEPYLFWGH
jgi:hypothetical protein